MHPQDSELGKPSAFDANYNPERLFLISRADKRIEIGINPNELPFYGFDCWTHYEVSWLNAKGKPMVAVAQLVYDCHSLKIIESKALKLYFNSLNQTQFDSTESLIACIKKDIESRMNCEIDLKIIPLSEFNRASVHAHFSGESIDALDTACSVYQVQPEYLETGDDVVEEVLYSDLLKSNCLITNQPDWGSVQIAYRGRKINREGLLRYIVSFRDHNEFHEQCIERIFADIMSRCMPEALTVYGRYTRRGGLDINPYRSTHKGWSYPGFEERLIRQ